MADRRLWTAEVLAQPLRKTTSSSRSSPATGLRSGRSSPARCAPSRPPPALPSRSASGTPSPTQVAQPALPAHHPRALDARRGGRALRRAPPPRKQMERHRAVAGGTDRQRGEEPFLLDGAAGAAPAGQALRVQGQHQEDAQPEAGSPHAPARGGQDAAALRRYGLPHAEMMGMLLEFAQWKPSRRNRQDTPPRSRQLYETIIDMISLYKYSSTEAATTTSADAPSPTARTRRAADSPMWTTSRRSRTR